MNDLHNQLSREGIRNAAILVSSLEPAEIDRLLDEFEPSQAAEVRQAMVELDPVDPQQQRRVIDEFLRADSLTGRPGPGTGSFFGPFRAEKCACPLPPAPEGDSPISADFAAEIGTVPPCPAAEPPFGFLEAVDPRTLAGLLADEGPQTIALILSHLSPERAGSVLGRLESGLQADVIHRLVDLDETEPEIVRAVESAVRCRLATPARDSHCDPADPPAAAPVAFDDLVRLDDESLAAVFDAIEPEVQLAAMVGATPQLIERLVRRFPPREAEAIRRELQHPGPIRLRDVEEAQARIARQAQRLAEEDRLNLPSFITGDGDPT